MSGLVATTDAAGELGRRVAERLARSGVRQRLIVQGDAAAPDVAGAEPVRIGGYDDADGMRAAFDGVDTGFLIPIRERADRARLHEAAVDAAIAAGAGRIVYSSFVGAAADASFTLARDDFATEQRIRSAGVPFTFLRGSAYFEVLHYIVDDDSAASARPTRYAEETLRRRGAGVPAGARCRGMARRGVGRDVCRHRARRARRRGRYGGPPHRTPGHVARGFPPGAPRDARAREDVLTPTRRRSDAWAR